MLRNKQEQYWVEERIKNGRQHTHIAKKCVEKWKTHEKKCLTEDLSAEVIDI